jgi:hypothetical protein
VTRLLRIGMTGPDVKTLQQDLNRVMTGPPGPLVDDGKFGPLTDGRVRAFQRAAYLTPDGIVGPQTRAALAAVLAIGPPAPATNADFVGFSDEQIKTVKEDIERARGFLDQVLDALAFVPFLKRSPTPLAHEALNNIYHVDFTQDLGTPGGLVAAGFAGADLLVLSRAFRAVRRSLDVTFPKVFHPPGSPPPAPNAGFFSAFVETVKFEPTMHFSERYFDPVFTPDGKSRALTILHERAHTVLRLAGHPGTNDNGFPDGKPHKGSRLVRDFNTALRNAYCYEWLTESLQPGYNPNGI